MLLLKWWGNVFSGVLEMLFWHSASTLAVLQFCCVLLWLQCFDILDHNRRDYIAWTVMCCYVFSQSHLLICNKLQGYNPIKVRVWKSEAKTEWVSLNDQIHKVAKLLGWDVFFDQNNRFHRYGKLGNAKIMKKYLVQMFYKLPITV